MFLEGCNIWQLKSELTLSRHKRSNYFKRYTERYINDNDNLVMIIFSGISFF